MSRDATKVLATLALLLGASLATIARADTSADGFADASDAAGPQAPALPMPARVGPNALVVRVAEVRVDGLGADSLSRDEIQDLVLELVRAAGGYFAPPSSGNGRRVRLRDLRGPSGTGTLLYGSAIQAILDRIVDAHRQRGFGEVGVSVSPRTLAQLGAPHSDAILRVRFDTPARAAARRAEVPAAAEAVSDQALVTARAVSIEMSGGDGIDEAQLLELPILLAWKSDAIPPGYVAPHRGVASRSLALWQLGQADHRGAQLYGSALNSILEQVTGALRARGYPSARVTLSDAALRHLGAPGGDGLLMLEVQLR